MYYNYKNVPCEWDIQFIKNLKRLYFFKYFNGNKIELYEDSVDKNIHKIYCVMNSIHNSPEIMGIYTYEKITSESIEILHIEEMLGFYGMFISILNKYIIQSCDYVIINLSKAREFLNFITLLLSNKSDLCRTKILKILDNSWVISSENIFNIIK